LVELDAGQFALVCPMHQLLLMIGYIGWPCSSHEPVWTVSGVWYSSLCSEKIPGAVPLHPVSCSHLYPVYAHTHARRPEPGWDAVTAGSQLWRGSQQGQINGGQKSSMKKLEHKVRK
jgi:hypothetical protein